MTTIDQQITALTLFNEKAQKLIKSSFVQIVSNPNAGVTIGFEANESGVGGVVRSEVRGPNEEAIESFVLTFRFFIQDNERISLRNIATIYAEANIDQQLKDHFDSARVAVNNFLDAPNLMNMNYNGTTPTNREILETFVYGGLAHATPQKHAKFKEWMGFPLMAAMTQGCFNMILGRVLHAISYIAQVNEKALKQLTSTSPT